MFSSCNCRSFPRLYVNRLVSSRVLLFYLFTLSLRGRRAAQLAKEEMPKPVDRADAALGTNGKARDGAAQLMPVQFCMEADWV